MTQSNLPSLFRREGLLPVNSLFTKVMKDFFQDDPFFEYGMEIAKSGYPKLDLIDDTDKVVIKAELAGMEKKNIKIEYKDDILSISGEKKEEKTFDKSNFVHQELRSGKFCRQIKINNDLIEVEKINAVFLNGVLTIEIPKKEEKIKKEKEYKIDIS